MQFISHKWSDLVNAEISYLSLLYWGWSMSHIIHHFKHGFVTLYWAQNHQFMRYLPKHGRLELYLSKQIHWNMDWLQNFKFGPPLNSYPYIIYDRSDEIGEMNVLYFQDLYCVRSDLGNLLKALGRLDEAKVTTTHGWGVSA
jgi:hypothetical protein